MIFRREGDDYMKFLIETTCPECYLVVYVDYELRLVEFAVATQHNVVAYPRTLWGRLRRAWDSLLGRYYDSEFVSLSPQSAQELVDLLRQALRALRERDKNAHARKQG